MPAAGMEVLDPSDDPVEGGAAGPVDALGALTREDSFPAHDLNELVVLMDQATSRPPASRRSLCGRSSLRITSSTGLPVRSAFLSIGCGL